MSAKKGAEAVAFGIQRELGELLHSEPQSVGLKQAEIALKAGVSRPLIKEVMRAERERQAMLRGEPVATAPMTPERSAPVENAHAAESGARQRRPLLKELMQAERERQAALRAGRKT